jgi:Helix-turn-helix of insertion element transposase
MRPKPFISTAKTEEAALLVAEDDLSDDEIASRVGINKATLERWKRRDEFRARVQQLIAEFATSLQQYHIARKDKRVGALNDRWLRMGRLIDARAAMLEDEIEGGETGLLVKEIVFSPDGERIAKYSTDTGLLSAFLAHEKQAAQETGQWTEKHEHQGEITMRTYRGVDVDEV